MLRVVALPCHDLRFFSFIKKFAIRRERRANIEKSWINTPKNQKMSKSCHQCLFHFTSRAPPSTTLHHFTAYLNYHQWQPVSTRDPTIQHVFLLWMLLLFCFFFCPYLGFTCINVLIINCNKWAQPWTTHFSPMFTDASNVNF
jgi:hypothetical protein